jgi:hypothetical protein
VHIARILAAAARGCRHRCKYRAAFRQELAAA